MTVTSTDIANEALQLIGNNSPSVTGVAPNFDSSPNGQACAKLYSSVVAAVAREWGWDMARNVVTLTASGNSPPAPYSNEYLYPSNGVEVWQVMPVTLTDPNDPLPVNFQVANTLVSAVQTKVIRCNFTPAQAVYNNNPNENVWDPLFRQAVVRLLASELAMATGGRPDTAKSVLETANVFEKIGEGRTE